MDPAIFSKRPASSAPSPSPSPRPEPQPAASMDASIFSKKPQAPAQTTIVSSPSQAVADTGLSLAKGLDPDSSASAPPTQEPLGATAPGDPLAKGDAASALPATTIAPEAEAPTGPVSGAAAANGGGPGFAGVLGLGRGGRSRTIKARAYSTEGSFGESMEEGADLRLSSALGGNVSHTPGGGGSTGGSNAQAKGVGLVSWGMKLPTFGQVVPAPKASEQEEQEDLMMTNPLNKERVEAERRAREEANRNEEEMGEESQAMFGTASTAGSQTSAFGMANPLLMAPIREEKEVDDDDSGGGGGGNAQHGHGAARYRSPHRHFALVAPK